MVKRRNNEYRNNDTIAHGAIVILVVAIAAKFASFIVEAVLAAYLGTTATADAYYMISGIQQVLYPMLSIGIWKVFLPEYRKVLSTEGHINADAFANKALFAFVAASVLFSALLALFSGPITSIVAPGFDQSTSELCAQLVCITSPMYIFIIASSVYATMLQCHGKFFGSQIREIVTHIPVIVAALFFFEKYGVWALACGLVIGAVFRLLVELPFMNWGYSFKLDWRVNNSRMRGMAREMPSALLASGANQVTIFVNKVIASLQSAGTVAALNYASKLHNVFLGLMSSAVLTASYPRIAEYIGLGNIKGLTMLITKIIAVIMAFMIPITLFSIVYGNDMVVVLFQRGAFDAEASAVTSSAFICYALGFLFSALFSLFNNVLYAFRQSSKAMWASVICMVVNVILSIGLAGHLGASGLALASSVSYLIASLWQANVVNRHVPLQKQSLFNELAKVALASSIALGVASMAFLLPIPIALRLIIGSVSFACVYLPLLAALKTLAWELGKTKALSVVKRFKRG